MTRTVLDPAHGDFHADQFVGTMDLVIGVIAPRCWEPLTKHWSIDSSIATM